MSERFKAITSGWIAILIAASVFAGLERAYYSERLADFQFQMISDKCQGRSEARISVLSDLRRAARYRGNRWEAVTAYAVVAIGIAGVTAMATGFMAWLLLGTSIGFGIYAAYMAAIVSGIAG